MWHKLINDDSFVVFRPPDQIIPFLEFLNSNHGQKCETVVTLLFIYSKALF